MAAYIYDKGTWTPTADDTLYDLYDDIPNASDDEIPNAGGFSHTAIKPIGILVSVVLWKRDSTQYPNPKIKSKFDFIIEFSIAEDSEIFMIGTSGIGNFLHVLTALRSGFGWVKMYTQLDEDAD